MDITHAKTLTTPAIKARFAPVLWEPMPGSGERICAIVLLVPEPDTTLMLTPAAHVVVNVRRLKAMLGAERGESAAGILQHAAEFMTRRLYVDADLEGCMPPFKGFHVGASRRVKGFTPEQVLDTAVRLVSAFGNADDLLDEGLLENNHSTATTREFLARVQTAFAPHDDERRKRFLQRVDTNAGSVTIDYVHKANLVQFATAPVTERQAQNMRREAEAKMLETMTVRATVMENNAKSRLIINTAPLFVGGISSGSQDTAMAAMAHYASIAKVHGFETTEVSNHEQAVHALLALD